MGQFTMSKRLMRRRGKLTELDYQIMHLPGVRAALHSHANTIGAHAKANLTSHRFTGKAYISVNSERPDQYVVLHSVHGAAMSIEYGRQAGRLFVVNTNKSRFVVGLHHSAATGILHDAAGLKLSLGQLYKGGRRGKYRRKRLRRG